GGLGSVVLARHAIAPSWKLEGPGDFDRRQKIAPRVREGKRELSFERFIAGLHARDQSSFTLRSGSVGGLPRSGPLGRCERVPGGPIVLEKSLPQCRLVWLEALPPRNRHFECNVVAPQAAGRYGSRAGTDGHPSEPAECSYGTLPTPAVGLEEVRFSRHAIHRGEHLDVGQRA